MLVAAMLAAPSLAQCLTISNPQANTAIPLTDDSGRVVALPFSFPFNGTNYTQIGICSNGFLWLGNVNGPWPYTDSEAAFLSDAPRIAPMWDDLNPGTGGSVYYMADAASAHVVWKNVPYFGQTANVANMEVVLLSNGAIIFHYASGMPSGSSTSITGITAGNGAPASPVTWSTNPAVAGATGYELFPAAGFSLSGTTFMLTPTGAATYATVPLAGGLPNCTGPFMPSASQAAFGGGCPRATGTFYEFFNGGQFDLSNTSILLTSLGGNQYLASAGPGLDNSFGPGDIQPQGDDTQVTVSTAGLSGGGFPYGGQTVTSVAACSNGYLWMTANALNDFSATELEFANQSPRIAPCWADWNFNPATLGGGGTFYWTQNANFCMATWENVAAYGQAGSQNTFQVKLLANGDVVFSYGTVTNNATLSATAIVGLSGGNTLFPAGSINMSGALTVPIIGHITPSQVTPLTHTVGAAPVLGSPYVLNASNIPVGTGLGAFVIGFVQLNPGVDLTGFGATGCYQFETIDFSTFLVVGGATMTFNLNIPSNGLFGGINLTSQAATFTPGANPLGVLTSNGIQGVIGF
jgi:hypothetical protein